MLTVYLSNSCLTDPEPRTCINHQSEKRNKYHTVCVQTPKLCSVIFRFLVFLDPLKEDASGRHNIIGYTKVGHPLSFEESIYGVLEPWKPAPLHREPSRCSCALSLVLINPCFEGRICSVVLVVSKKHQVRKSPWKWTLQQDGYLKNVVRK